MRKSWCMVSKMVAGRWSKLWVSKLSKKVSGIMAFRIVKVADFDNIPFKNLQQLYEYEFSPITGYRTNENGLYDPAMLVSHWSKKHDIYLLYDHSRPIGFAVVNLHSVISQADDTRDMAEFFVLADMRKHGIGKWFVKEIFAKYPGKWEVRQLPGLKVKAFWLKVISEFTHNNYRDFEMSDAQWTGSVQQFSC